MPQSSGPGVAGSARIEAPEKGGTEEAVNREAKRELRMLDWRLSANNLLTGVVRQFGLPARVYCMIKALRQVPEVRSVSALVCTRGHNAFPYIFGVTGAAEGTGAIQLARETEPAS